MQLGLCSNFSRLNISADRRSLRVWPKCEQWPGKVKFC